MRFFVAKVNLTEQAKLGFSYLRPLQVAYESPKFMLPIRLGMVNADGAQELFVYALTRKGRVETTNYRTVRLPTGMELPVVSEGSGEFAGVLQGDVRATRSQKQDGRAVFLEYAWDMKWCDPCAADPLSADELRQLGVFWDDGAGQAPNVFLTRLHVRYDKRAFPRGSRVPGDRRPRQLPGPLRPAPSRGPATRRAKRRAGYRRSVRRAPGSGSAAAGRR